MKPKAMGTEVACPLCHSKRTTTVWRENGREFALCPVCRLVSVPPSYHLDAGAEVERYLQHENSLDNAGYVAMFRKKIDIVKQVCMGVDSVLDFGCGPEPVLKILLQREGYRADAYDPHFFPAWPQRQAWDLIISTETFEHLKQPGAEIENLVSRLRPSGYLAIMTRFHSPARENFSTERFGEWYYKRDPTHIAFFCPETFAWIAARFHLRIVHDNGTDFVVLQKTNLSSFPVNFC
ncbi:MAG: hypothetical protein COV67_13370 [Nitrospinae bacterium CG11_big_fil_rev_8_21_14_0_20_56_8]|nr:MAG: hypothetical protein COV67_13370 [Nitrospinae bacterium CG11_big_fil_rev_8_21_14_0_20_56_8]